MMTSEKSLIWRLTLRVVLTALVIGVFFNVVQIVLDFKSESEKASLYIDNIISSVEPTARDIVYKLDPESAGELISGLLNYDFVTEVIVQDESGHVLAEKGRAQLNHSSTLWFTKKFFGEFDNQKVTLVNAEDPTIVYGSLTLKINRDKMFTELYSRALFIFISGLTRNIFLSLVVLAIFYLFLAKPLGTMAKVFSDIDPKSIDGKRLPSFAGHEKDELGRIVDSANLFLDNNETYLAKTKEALQGISNYARYLQRILQTTTQGFWFVSRTWITEDVNPSMCRILGRDREELIGYPVQEFIAEGSRNVLQEQMAKRQKGEGGTYRVEFIHSSGEKKLCTLTANPFFDDKGEQVGSFAMVSDLSDMQKAKQEKERLEMKLQQSQKMEVIGTLAGGIAHDFNNILGIILGYSELARENAGTDELLANDLDEVINAGKRGKGLVQQILAYSRQEDVSRKALDPVPLAHEAVTMLRSSFPANVQLELKVPPLAGPIFANPTQFNQVLVNLSTNALNAVEIQGGTIEVSIKQRDVAEMERWGETRVNPGKYVQVSVKDSGPGIEPEVQRRMFEPYFTTRADKGTGMGLSIVLDIVKRSNGLVTYETIQGQGSVFHVFFPVMM